MCCVPEGSQAFSQGPLPMFIGRVACGSCMHLTRYGLQNLLEGDCCSGPALWNEDILLGPKNSCSIDCRRGTLLLNPGLIFFCKLVKHELGGKTSLILPYCIFQATVVSVKKKMGVLLSVLMSVSSVSFTFGEGSLRMGCGTFHHIQGTPCELQVPYQTIDRHHYLEHPESDSVFFQL